MFSLSFERLDELRGLFEQLALIKWISLLYVTGDNNEQYIFYCSLFGEVSASLDTTSTSDFGLSGSIQNIKINMPTVCFGLPLYLSDC